MTAVLRVLVEEDGGLWCELATDRWWALPNLDGDASIIGPDEVWPPGRTRASVERDHTVREVLLTSAPKPEDLTQQRARVYAAFHGQRLVRGGVLGRTRALDAPEMQRIAAIAVEALRPGSTP